MKATVVDHVVAEVSRLGSVNELALLSAAYTRSRVERSRVHRHIGPRRSLSSSGRLVAIAAAAGHPHPPEFLGRREESAMGCAISKKVDGVHVLDRGEFDPAAEEYQVIAPIAGG